MVGMHSHAERPEVVINGHRVETAGTVERIHPDIEYMIPDKRVLDQEGSVADRREVFPEKRRPVDPTEWPLFGRLASK